MRSREKLSPPTSLKQDTVRTTYLRQKIFLSPFPSFSLFHSNARNEWLAMWWATKNGIKKHFEEHRSKCKKHTECDSFWSVKIIIYWHETTDRTHTTRKRIIYIRAVKVEKRISPEREQNKRREKKSQWHASIVFRNFKCWIEWMNLLFSLWSLI